MFRVYWEEVRKWTLGNWQVTFVFLLRYIHPCSFKRAGILLSIMFYFSFFSMFMSSSHHKQKIGNWSNILQLSGGTKGGGTDEKRKWSQRKSKPLFFPEHDDKKTTKWSTFQNGRPVNASIMFIQTSWTIKERVKVFEVNISTSEYLNTLPFSTKTLGKTLDFFVFL